MSKKLLKVSFQDPNSNLHIEQFLDKSNSLLSEWDVVFNSPSVRKADVWFVIEALNPNDTVCEINPKNIFFGSAETAQNINHIEGNDARLKFLSQFNRVFTFHQYLGENAENAAPFLPWMINANHGNSIWMPHERNVDFFENLESMTKTKNISVFCSTQSLTPAHEMRIRFTSKLKEHFGDELDWVGNGVNSVREKWMGMHQYKYNIVLENQKRYNVITEKIGDAFLALNYPFYWGAPNIGNVFNHQGLTEIDIEDFRETVLKIENSIKSNFFENNFESILENKFTVLHEFNFINRMLKIANNHGSNYQSVTQVHLQDESDYVSYSKATYFKLQNKFERIISPIDKSMGTNLYEIATSFYKLFRYNKFTRAIFRISKNNAN